MELFIIIWLICAGLVMALASDENRGMAALLGFLLGPIGVLIAAVKLSK